MAVSVPKPSPGSCDRSSQPVGRLTGDDLELGAMPGPDVSNRAANVSVVSKPRENPP